MRKLSIVFLFYYLALYHAFIFNKCKSHTSFNAINYGGLQHAGVIVSNVEESKKFYMDIFECTDDSDMRPKTLPYPGAFLRFGADQIHLMQVNLIFILAYSKLFLNY